SGDINLDGRVNQADYLNVIANMGSSSGEWILGDVNRDGVVNVGDFAAVSANLGAGDGAGEPLLLVSPVAHSTAGHAGDVVPQAAPAKVKPRHKRRRMHVRRLKR